MIFYLTEADRINLTGMQTLLDRERNNDSFITEFNTKISQILACGTLTSEDVLHLGALFALWVQKSECQKPKSDGKTESFLAPDSPQDPHVQQLRRFTSPQLLQTRQILYNQEASAFRAWLQQMQRMKQTQALPHSRRLR